MDTKSIIKAYELIFYTQVFKNLLNIDLKIY